MSTLDPKQAFEAETSQQESQQIASLSMISGSSGSSGFNGSGFSDGDANNALGEQSTGGRNLLGHTTWLIALVAVVAAGSLYAMRLTQNEKPDKSSGELEARMDNWITKLSAPDKVDPNDPLHPNNLGQLFHDTSQVLTLLNSDSTSHQVPIRYVKKNPFMFTFDATAPNTVADATAAEMALAHQREQMEKVLKQYRLDSIMIGRRNVAIINNEMVQVGDHLGDFVVEEIDQMQVVVRRGDQRFRLTIDNQSTTPGKHR